MNLLMKTKALLLFIAISIILLTTNNQAVFSSEKTKITLWHSWQDAEILKEKLRKFEKENKDIVVNVNALPFFDFRDTFMSSAKSDQGPDLFIAPNDWIGPIAEKGYIQAIDSMTKKDKGLLKQFVSPSIEAVKYKNKLYGLPLALETVTLIYNPNLIKTPPKTTDELLALAIKNTGKGKFGLIYDIDDFYYSVCWFHGFGAKVLDKNGKPDFDSPAAQKAAKFIASFCGKYEIMPDDINYSVVATLFNQQRAAMIIIGPWSKLDSFKVPYKITRLPMVKETKKWAAPYVGVRTIMMNRYSRNKTVAFRLMKFLTSAEVTAALGRETKVVPANKGAYKDSVIKKDAAINAFRSQAEVGIPMPNSIEMSAVWGPAMESLGFILNRTKTPDLAMKEAQKKILAEIEKISK